MPKQTLCINLGGEGEVPDVINQQGSWVLNPLWMNSNGTKTLAELVADGHDFMIAPNPDLPFPDGVVDDVITNNVPIDIMALHGPGVQSSEIRRILKAGGRWIDNGSVVYVKP
jgi:hypothetical protein